MLLKLLLLAVVIGIVYIFFIKQKPKKSEKKESLGEEIMLECHRCKTYVSNKEAIIKDGRFYCSKECANGGQK